MHHGAGYYCSLQTAGRTVMQSAVIQSRVYHSANFGAERVRDEAGMELEGRFTKGR